MQQTAKEIKTTVASKADQSALDKANTNISTLQQTAEEIKTTVASKADQSALDDANTNISTLQSTVSVQSSYVGAMVKGGKAEGHMSLSLELPVVIDSTTRDKMVELSSETVVAAVYAQLADASGTAIKGSYAIKAAPAEDSLKALWDACVKGGLLASQIELTAAQIKVAVKSLNIDAEKVQINGETIINNAKKIKADLIDVDSLFAQNIVIGSQGSVCSKDYSSENDRGFKISGNGDAEFSQIMIKGNSVFKGDIDSGPLMLNSINPSNSKDEVIYEAGASTKPLMDRIIAGESGYFACSGSYKGVNFVYYKLTKYEFKGMYSGYITLYKKGLKRIPTDEDSSSSHPGIALGEKWVNATNYYTFLNKLILTTYNPTGKTFKLKDLPTSAPTEAGYVWVDSEGYLRLTT